MNKLRIGIIGCSGVAQKRFLPALALSEKVELTVMSSRSKAKAEEFAAKWGGEPVEGYENVLTRNDIDAVYISTPNNLHLELATIAAQTKKHILCEKSLTCSATDTENLIAVCAENDVGILEGFMYQFHPQHRMAKDLVKADEIGKPHIFNASFGFPPLSDDNFRYNQSLGGGALLDACAYTVHSARQFFGREPIVRGSLLHNGRYDVDIQGSALLDFGDGQSATIGFGFDNFYQNSYSIWGSKGKITLTRAYSIPVDLAPSIVVERQDYRNEVQVDPYNQFLGEIEAFCFGVNDSSTKQRWRDDAIAQAKVLEAIKEGARENCTLNQ